METKMCARKLGEIKRRCGFTQELYIDPIGLAGGLAIWWCDNVSFTVLYKSKNIIHVCIESNGMGLPKFLSLVYGPPKDRERRVVWELMKSLVATIEDSWLVVGDFNDLIS
ncbi:hypothetical protein QN277_016596 [Acacia crassicarpa]|uniref:Endonuclease/exonuclease/phosphatase n=1 Tax=Acacia crassicarpa TaxID=499986 RepID=A0AAE1MWX7_9FABA|nr:hypothetical protein QN277_016596 [Acacia crassicarpa]